MEKRLFIMLQDFRSILAAVSPPAILKAKKVPGRRLLAQYNYYYYYYYYFYKIDSGRMFSLVFIVLGSGLQQVTTGPRSLFSFFLQGQYFP